MDMNLKFVSRGNDRSGIEHLNRFEIDLTSTAHIQISVRYQGSAYFRMKIVRKCQECV